MKPLHELMLILTGIAVLYLVLNKIGKWIADDKNIIWLKTLQIPEFIFGYVCAFCIFTPIWGWLCLLTIAVGSIVVTLVSTLQTIEGARIEVPYNKAVRVLIGSLSTLFLSIYFWKEIVGMK